MKSHPRSRLYVGKLLDGQDALMDAMLNKAIRVRTGEPSRPPRDWTLMIAAICIGVGMAGAFVALVWAVVTSGGR